MSTKFIIHDNEFKDNSSIIKEYYNQSSLPELSDIYKELGEIKNKLDERCDLYRAIEELQNKINSPKDAKATVLKYIKEFTMPIFSDLASETLKKFIGLS